jgi:hypothetical protein
VNKYYNKLNWTKLQFYTFKLNRLHGNKLEAYYDAIGSNKVPEWTEWKICKESRQNIQ